MALFVDWAQSNQEFLTGLILGAFIVWILTYHKHKTLRTKLVEQTQKDEQLVQVWDKLDEQDRKVEYLLQAKQAAKTRAKELDLSNHSNQIKFIEKAVLRSRKPITAESFRAVYAVLEKSLERKYRILAEVSLGSFIGTDDKSHSNYASDLAFRSINSKRVDFLIIDPVGVPQLAIEYHGSGHFQGNAESRDAVKRLIFQKVGIPLLEFKEGVSAENVRNVVMKNLR